MTLLGLEKIRSKTVPADLSKKIFDRDDAYRVVEYGNRVIKFEVFISTEKDSKLRRLDHICLEVADREDLLNRATTLELKTRKVPKQDDYIVFIEDFDGNLFELKPKI